jgi:hypothetical protein
MARVGIQILCADGIGDVVRLRAIFSPETDPPGPQDFSPSAIRADNNAPLKSDKEEANHV